jgi:hypothetical protein
MTPRRAQQLFVGACVLSILAIALYIAVARPRSPSDVAAPVARGTFITAMPSGPVILFRDASPGALYGRLAMRRLPLTPDADPLVAPLSCERVHYAAGAGICLVADEARLPPRYIAYVFDDTFTQRHEITLTGPPIRARVSPDGRRAAVTVFESGHSYADDAFSTKTQVIDTGSGAVLGDLEAFRVRKDGQPFASIDFNFWGVTFARDGDHFFATLKTKGERYLVKGSVDARVMDVVRAGVECPSLSPDETMIVFKKPLVGEVGWRLHLLDLASGEERPLNQVRRSVDDQVDWFDNRHIVYHDSASEGTGVWILPIDGVSPPRLLLPNAYSPAVRP